MKRFGLFISALVLIGFAAGNSASADVTKAKAKFKNAQGEGIGEAKLTQLDRGVRISIQLSNLPVGTHAFHIHAVGKCDPPDFKSAGPHFNPHEKEHGMQNPKGAHAGDLHNVIVGEDGTANILVAATEVTLGEGEHSLFHPEGTSLVIHESADDNLTDPAGNAGARIACGVITKD